MLCQDVSAAVEDITTKFVHVYDGYTCLPNGKPKLNENAKVLSVRVTCTCFCGTTCKHGRVVLYAI